ncbi:hypothetical protein M5K25_027854 [Dendrobium thyrsiflorum]|uniref:Uncharacterized protein n=1 Tax=Dendrobium thyrsiflorum TaxID=117978 RepID=A0ABD0TUW6_DENTH
MTTVRRSMEGCDWLKKILSLLRVFAAREEKVGEGRDKRTLQARLATSEDFFTRFLGFSIRLAQSCSTHPRFLLKGLKVLGKEHILEDKIHTDMNLQLSYTVHEN